jgi:hypothetical protein
MLAIKRLAGRRIGRDFPALLHASLESRQNITGSAWTHSSANRESPQRRFKFFRLGHGGVTTDR